MKDGLVIREETPDDFDQIDIIQTQAFGSDEPIAALVAGLRALTGPLPTCGLVAVKDQQIVGHVMVSGHWLDAPQRMIDVAVLSPLGVAPEHQTCGIGSALLVAATVKAEEIGAPLVFLEGDPRYYGPRGFQSASDAGFRAPSLRIPDRAFQVQRLDGFDPSMDGTLVYRDIFWALDCVGLR